MNLFAGVLVRGGKLRSLSFVDGCLSRWVMVLGWLENMAYGIWASNIFGMKGIN